jgi:hypothetical protein
MQQHGRAERCSVEMPGMWVGHAASRRILGGPGRPAHQMEENLQSLIRILPTAERDMESSFTDSDGVLWNVREDGADDVRSFTSDIPPGTTWLRFESELEVRRLWHYPDDWRGLSPIQMESLLDRASTVIARFRPAPHRAPHGNTSLGGARQQASGFRPASRQDMPPEITPPRDRRADE